MTEQDIGYTLKKYADFGTSEPWCARISVGLEEIIRALMISESEKQKMRDALGEVSDELGAAFIALKKVRGLETNRYKTVLELNREYSDFYDHLWRAYKDRFQTFCSALGYNIGFLFEKKDSFEKKSIQFIKNNPSISDRFRKRSKIFRRLWQNGLSDLRNLYIQHKQVGREIEGLYYRVDVAERYFLEVWQAIEEISVSLLRTRIPLEMGIDIAEIPENQRDRSCPKKYHFIMKKP